MAFFTIVSYITDALLAVTAAWLLLRGHFAATKELALVPLLTALVVCLVMKGKMKSARLQTQADAYITQDSLRLTRQDDRYITTTQTRVKIETAKSGGTSVNSGGFSHSSGKF